MLGGIVSLTIGGGFYSYADGPEGFESADGLIVEYVPNDGGDFCAPRIEFSVDGVLYSATGTVYSSCSRPVNVERDVFYNPTNPAEAVVDRPISSSIARGFFVVGALFLISSAVGVFFIRRSYLNSR